MRSKIRVLWVLCVIIFITFTIFICLINLGCVRNIVFHWLIKLVRHIKRIYAFIAIKSEFIIFKKAFYKIYG